MNDYGKRWLIEQRGYDDVRHSPRRKHRDDRYDDDYDMNDYYDEADVKRGKDMRDMRDSRDYHDVPEMRLKKSEANRWLHEMENTDGTKGPHYTMPEVMHVADKLGIKFSDFSEREFYIAVNMWYSDYGHIVKKLVGDNREKELMVNADFAKAYLEDPDGADASEKLAITYHCLRDDK